MQFDNRKDFLKRQIQRKRLPSCALVIVEICGVNMELRFPVFARLDLRLNNISLMDVDVTVLLQNPLLERRVHVIIQHLLAGQVVVMKFDPWRRLGDYTNGRIGVGCNIITLTGGLYAAFFDN